MPYIISANKNLAHVMGDVRAVKDLQIGDICSPYGPLAGFDTAIVIRANAEAVMLCRFHLDMKITFDVGGPDPRDVIDRGSTDEEADAVLDRSIELRRETVVVARDAELPNGGGPLRFYVHQRIHRH